MPKSKYEQIYKSLKKRIDSGEYNEGSYLPSENTLIQIYDCSRNTVRRAISHLTMEGYVQPHHGKGVRVIHSSSDNQPKYDYLITDAEGVYATGKRYGFSVRNKVIAFEELTVDEHLAQKTGFPKGIQVYLIQRVRYIDDVAKMIDTSLLRKDVVGQMNEKIAEKSLFNYYSKNLGMEIATIKRKITMVEATPLDEKYLELGDFNCLPMITSRIYNNEGTKFEFSESRNRPDLFVFNSITSRSLAPKK